MELNSIISDNIINELENSSGLEEVALILQKYQQYELKGTHLGRAFEKMFVSSNGLSKFILMSELEKYHHSFHTTNGGDWCRSNQGYLGKRYNIIRKKQSGSIFSVKIDGINKKTDINSDIRKDIVSIIKKRKCAILDVTTNIECEYKIGMKDACQIQAKDKLYQKIEDFQALSKAASDAKQHHCKLCKKLGKRYDAKRLGYSSSFISGTENSKTCIGCYWYDPVAFNREISKNFEIVDK